MSPAWLSNSLPDCLFDISQLAQIEETICKEDKTSAISKTNKAIRRALDNHLELKIKSLDLATLKVIGFSDASFANNRGLSPQLVHIGFLSDESTAAIAIAFKSYKSKRIARSAMHEEEISFSDLSDISLSIGNELDLVLGKHIPVQILTDSKCLFDVTSRRTRTSEKQTMIDIVADREALQDQLVSGIGLVRSEHNMTNRPKNK